MKLILYIIALILINCYANGQSMPKYTAMVGGQEGGLIWRGAFIAQQGVRGMRFIAGNHWEGLPIDSFTLLVQRDTLILYTQTVNGMYFNEKLKKEIQIIETGDRILVFNIYGHDVDKKVVFIRPIEFIIK